MVRSDRRIFARAWVCDDNTVIALSHIGHLVERTQDELEKEAATVGFEVAWDGRVFEF